MKLLVFSIVLFITTTESMAQEGFHQTYEFYQDNLETARDIHVLDDGLLVIGLGSDGSNRYTYILKLKYDGDTLWTKKYYDIYGRPEKTFVKNSWLYMPGYQLFSDGTSDADGFRLYKFNLKGNLIDSRKYSLNKLIDPPVDEISYYVPIGTIAWQDRIVVYGMIYEANYGTETEVFSRGLVIYYNEDLTYDTMVIVQPRYEECQIFDAHIDANGLLTILVDDDLKNGNGKKRLFRGFAKYDTKGNKIWASEPFEIVNPYRVILSFDILSNQDMVTYYLSDSGVNIGERGKNSHILVSYDSEGNLNWEYQVDPKLDRDERVIVDVEQSIDGHILICGQYYDNTGERQGAYLAKHDRDTGELLWERVYQDWRDRGLQIRGLSKKIEILSMKINEQGKVYMAGAHTRITESNSIDYDIAVISVDEEGCLQPECGGFEQDVAGTPKYHQMFYDLSSWIEQDPTAPDNFYQDRFAIRGDSDRKDSIYSVIRTTVNLGPTGGVDGEFTHKFQNRNEGKKIYAFNEEEDTLLLYDFTLDVGDVFESGYTSHSLKVIESDTILLINGAKRRTWTLACDENPENTLTWIEGIGTNYGMHWPKDFCIGEYGDVRLSCHFIYDRLHYMNPEFEECLNPISSTDDLAFKALSSIKATPNPTQDRITLTAPQDLHITRTDLLDTQGRTHTQHYEHNSEVMLDLSSYPAGLYFVSVYTYKGNVVKKIVKN